MFCEKMCFIYFPKIEKFDHFSSVLLCQNDPKLRNTMLVGSKVERFRCACVHASKSKILHKLKSL